MPAAPKTGRKRTRSAWLGPNWAAVLWRASLRLATEIPIQVHATSARTNVAARPFDARPAVIYQGLLKACPAIQATACFTIAYSSERNELRARADSSEKRNFACAELPRPAPVWNGWKQPRLRPSGREAWTYPAQDRGLALVGTRFALVPMETSFAAAGATSILELRIGGHQINRKSLKIGMGCDQKHGLPVDRLGDHFLFRGEDGLRPTETIPI